MLAHARASWPKRPTNRCFVGPMWDASRLNNARRAPFSPADLTRAAANPSSVEAQAAAPHYANYGWPPMSSSLTAISTSALYRLVILCANDPADLSAVGVINVSTCQMGPRAAALCHRDGDAAQQLAMYRERARLADAIVDACTRDASPCTRRSPPCIRASPPTGTSRAGQPPRKAQARARRRLPR